VSEAIKRALDMPLDERIARWQSLYDGIKREDVTWWRERFLSALDAAQQRTS
jgi:trehalose 6-phosphate synthase